MNKNMLKSFKKDDFSGTLNEKSGMYSIDKNLNESM